MKTEYQKKLARAQRSADSLALDCEVTKTQVKNLVERLHKQGIITAQDHQSIFESLRDRGQCAEDALSELVTVLNSK